VWASQDPTVDLNDRFRVGEKDVNDELDLFSRKFGGNASERTDSIFSLSPNIRCKFPFGIKS
jgi:hypothetical protein